MTAANGAPPDDFLVEALLVFSLADLSRASGASGELLTAWVGEGWLEPSGAGPDDWRFSGAWVPRVRSALRLSRDFELSVPGAVLVMELLAEIEALRQRVRQSSTNA